MSVVTLRPVTEDNLAQVVALKVAPEQERSVAPNVYSLAEAAVTDDVMFRATYAGEEPVGFLMLSERRSVARYYLWRFMIDESHQGKGYGSEAMELLIDYVRNLGDATQLYLSYVPGEASPGPFYARLGFVDTGLVSDGENEAVLSLS
jgi:diamine N-acetyltransferase